MRPSTSSQITTGSPRFKRRHILAFLLAGLGLLLWIPAAQAYCDSFHPVPEFYVGDTDPSSPTYDAKCTHNDLPSAIAAATCVYGTKIFLTHEHLYANQHLTIDNKNVTLIGRADGDACGPASEVICNPVCGPPPLILAPLATISGGSSGGSVITIVNASNVTLQYLDIRDGANTGDNGSGGGIYFNGHGSLTLLTSTIEHNHAQYGGGIDVTPSGGSATLTLGANAMVTFNTADISGGGIRLEGDSNLVADEDRTLIGYNTATTSNGGGLEVIGPARADIGSPGLALDGVIYANQAQYGGGIAVFGGPNGAAGYVNLYTTDPQRPVTVSGNSADQWGGAVYLRGDSADSNAVATFCAANARVIENAALEGAALYLDWQEAKSAAYINRASCGGPTGVRCAPGVACNEIAGNESRDSSTNTLSGGGVIVLDGSLDADRVALHDNNAGSLVRHLDYGSAKLSNCLITHNPLSYEVFYRSADTPLSVDQCTIADNDLGGGPVFGDNPLNHFSDYPILTNSIVVQPDSPSGWVPQVHYTLADKFYGPDPTVHLLTGSPGFVDAPNGDYHLLLDSPAVDYAAGIGRYEPDLDGNPHEVNLATVVDVFGPRDAGAYERQSPYACDNSSEYLFCGGFEMH